MQDVAYVGIGVDECDKCRGGEVDVDIGVVLLSCGRGGTKALGGASKCTYYDHMNYAHKSARSANYKISEDDRSGEGEGDDEWAFLNLAGLRTSGVTHVMVVANIWGCAHGSPTSSIGWQDLEGAFLRVTGSSANSKEFSNAETIGYIDLDGMNGPAKNGAGQAHGIGFGV
ncbi:kptA [Symbiodinium sp. CCMP2456]|nr:kptA [Symbiodinium sp. CCMP2456]